MKIKAFVSNARFTLHYVKLSMVADCSNCHIVCSCKVKHSEDAWIPHYGYNEWLTLRLRVMSHFICCFIKHGDSNTGMSRSISSRPAVSNVNITVKLFARSNVHHEKRKRQLVLDVNTVHSSTFRNTLSGTYPISSKVVTASHSQRMLHKVDHTSQASPANHKQKLHAAAQSEPCHRSRD